ncbi:hypothetical protein [Parvicella tangerina]|uniref:DUF1574 domain-containing protein n=1 Tax=Parvicella tangerina TaxID=2829795 RepID=A0A916NIM8_9FLAO|nr:hypothetical protein [Parvicella tangerina]CAG5084315.1 hypothetical protein CRYO30217_02434 [Parvicella tangerina]
MTLVVVINQLLSFWYVSIMKHSSLFKVDEKYQQLEESTHFNTFVMGHSHTFALQEDMFENMFSFASTAETIDYTYYKFLHALEEKKLKIDTLILPLGIDYLKETKMDNAVYPFYWNRYLEFNSYLSYSNEKWSFFKNSVIGYIAPYVNGSNDIFDYYFSAGNEGLIRESNSVIPDSLVDFQIPKGTLDSQYLFHYHFLEKIAITCADRNIELILITFPVTKQYFGKTASKIDPNEYFTSLKERFSKKNLAFNHLDFSRHYSSDCFRDPHHLEENQIRIEFTDLVLKQIRKLK